MDFTEERTVTENVDGDALQHRFTPDYPLLVDRWFARLPISRGWIVAVIGVVLLLIPAILAFGADNNDFATVIYDRRAQFIYALIVVCSLMIVPAVEKRRENVVRALRPVIQLDDSAFPGRGEPSFRGQPDQGITGLWRRYGSRFGCQYTL